MSVKHYPVSLSHPHQHLRRDTDLYTYRSIRYSIHARSSGHDAADEHERDPRSSRRRDDVREITPRASLDRTPATGQHTPGYRTQHTSTPELRALHSPQYTTHYLLNTISFQVNGMDSEKSWLTLCKDDELVQAALILCSMRQNSPPVRCDASAGASRSGTTVVDANNNDIGGEGCRTPGTGSDSSSGSGNGCNVPAEPYVVMQLRPVERSRSSPVSR